MVLEGGYNLNSLKVSSMAVIRTLQLNPNDSEAMNGLLQELSGDETITYESLREQALDKPRNTFEATAVKLQATLCEHWKDLAAPDSQKLDATMKVVEEMIEHKHNYEDYKVKEAEEDKVL